MKNKQFTPYEGVNILLNPLLVAVKEILKDQFFGMYLFGSLAVGDFDEYSDVDILIVTNGEISETAFSEMQSMHEKIGTIDSPWAIQLEVSYIPQDALHHFDPAHTHHPHLDRGSGEKMHIMDHANDWIVQRHILREKGIVIEGPLLFELVEPVSPNDLRQAVADVLPLWINPLLENPVEHIKPRGYQSFIVLSLCRMLYTLQLGEVASKPLAAKWAIQTLDNRWTPLIERAIIGRQNARLEVEPDDLNETLDLIRYTAAQIKPTPYLEVNQALNLLHSSAKEILGDQFVGMYLYGSLAYGDFNPETSDIDFLFVTQDSLSEKTIAELEELHNRTWATSLKRAGKLEGAYVPKKLIRKHDPNGEKCPTINEGKFYLDKLGSDWIIQRHVIREYSVPLEGPDPKTLIDFVTSEDIRISVLGVLREWWFPMLEDPSWLREHDSRYHSFAVITMCRVLHALEHGTIVSKPKAIQWAKQKLDRQCNLLIDKAVAASNHEEQDDFLNETLDFISYVKNFVGENFDHIS